jgi:Domain of unknown function (DUF4394)
MTFPPITASRVLVLAVALLVAGCVLAPEPIGPLRPETVYAVTDRAELIRFNAGQPQRVLQRVPLQGLASGDRLVGIDFRVARGVLFALSANGQLYTLDTATARLSPVGGGAPIALNGQRFGVDFNPVADRLSATPVKTCACTLTPALSRQRTRRWHQRRQEPLPCE